MLKMLDLNVYQNEYNKNIDIKKILLKTLYIIKNFFIENFIHF